MKITFDDCDIQNCGTGVSVPRGSSVDVTFTKSRITECKTAFEERDPVSFAESLGLPGDTPAELIVEALKALQEKQGDPEETLKKSKLWTYLGRATDSAAAIQMLVSFAGAMVGVPLAF